MNHRWAPALCCAALLAAADVDDSHSEMRAAIERYTADQAALARSYPIEISPGRRERMLKFQREWLAELPKLNFDAMGQDGRVDYLLFRNRVQHEIRRLELQAKSEAEVAPLTPFAAAIIGMEEARRRMEPIDPAKAAAALDALAKQIDATHKSVEAGLAAKPVKKTTGAAAAANVTALQNTLRHWFDFYNDYDPLFTWWAATPYKAASTNLQNYLGVLREKVAGVKAAQQAGATSDIVGSPIGRDGLMSELSAEMIPYTPEELIDIANKEFAWCENEMKRASRDLGYGDDWRKALEHVKNLYVEPGKQPQLIRDQAIEAIQYMDDHDLVTIPPLARESWRMEMMSPERQLVNPFFTGGETISVSYPVQAMTEEQKLMSMRGNNIHFSRATVFHELIPGHHLQGFMAQRYKPYRQLFRTPFFVEGWSLYWELLLWDMNFAKSPENRIGMLFWRMHRCARIVFSLSFHLEKMTPDECINMLVERVGHERENAIGEVRRSFAGNYTPLYQAAYLLGGMQIRSLHRELVESGKMTNRQFHDAMLREGSIPVEMVRAKLTAQKLGRDFVSEWRFYR